jgi:hypothetical protein
VVNPTVDYRRLVQLLLLLADEQAEPKPKDRE